LWANYDSVGSRYGDCHGCVDRPWLSGGFCMVLEANANANANAKRNEVGNPAVFICTIASTSTSLASNTAFSRANRTLAAAGSFVLREILYSAVRRTQRGALRGPRA
jgi:hypothetical protein